MIVSVVWKKLGNRIEVTHADGESEKVKAGQLVAAEVARDAGLTFVPNRDGMAHCAREPDSREGACGLGSEPHPSTRRRPGIASELRSCVTA